MNDKNSLLVGLNIRKTELSVKQKRPQHMHYLSFNEGFEALAQKTKEEIKILVAPEMKIGGFRGVTFLPSSIPDTIPLPAQEPLFEFYEQAALSCPL